MHNQHDQKTSPKSQSTLIVCERTPPQRKFYQIAPDSWVSHVLLQKSVTGNVSEMFYQNVSNFTETFLKVCKLHETFLHFCILQTTWKHIEVFAKSVSRFDLQI